MCAVSRSVLEHEHRQRWRDFWVRMSMDLLGRGFSASINDTTATVRRCGQTLATFSITTTPSDIEAQLEALTASPAPHLPAGDTHACS